jgi:hypothetical protein
MSLFKGVLPIKTTNGTDLTSNIKCEIIYSSKEQAGDAVLTVNGTTTALPVNMAHPEFSTKAVSNIKAIQKVTEQVDITVSSSWDSNAVIKIGATNYRTGAFKVSTPTYMDEIDLTIQVWWNGANGWNDDYYVYYSRELLKPPLLSTAPNLFTIESGLLAAKKQVDATIYDITIPLTNGIAYVYAAVGNHNFSELRFAGSTEFDKVRGISTSVIAASAKDSTDPVAQTFYVNPREYPNGLFLSKADIYFSQKPETGSSSTAWIYITKTVNGYPSSDSYLTNSRVEIPYASVNSPGGTSIAPIPVATTFTFSDPIHLEAGEYAIVVGSENAKYRVFVSELGSTDLSTGKLISTNPDGNVGSFFMSQNARTWTADQTKDMMFNIHKCVFNTNSLDVEIPLIKDSDSIISDMISVTSPDKEIAGTSLKYYSKLGGDYIPVNNNTNTKLTARTTLSSATTPYVKFNLSSTSTNLSPVIQKDKINMKFFQNAINTKLDLLVDETDPYKGNAAAKYVTKKVVLADGFDATGIRVLLDVNRLHGTSVEVFFKAVAGDDFAKFEDHSYIQIPLKGDVQYSSTDNDFVIDEYKLDDFYYQLGKVNYSSFKTFIVKVVMYSDNPVNFPRVKNLRAIATS